MSKLDAAQAEPNYDYERNALERGEGFPLYTVRGDLALNASAFVNASSSDVSPSLMLGDESQPGGALFGDFAKPLNALLVLFAVCALIYIFVRKSGGVPKVL